MNALKDGGSAMYPAYTKNYPPEMLARWEQARRQSLERAARTSVISIGVVITCHNYGRYLSTCINSVLTQTLRPTQTVVVDDASTDSTPEVVSKFKTQITYVRGEWHNANKARNAGYAALKSCEYVMFIDADDWLSSNHLFTLHRTLSANALFGGCYGGLQFWKEVQGESVYDGLAHYIQAYDAEKLIFKNLVPGGNVLLRTCAFEQVGRWNEKMTYLSDWALALSMSRYGWSFLYEPNPACVLNYRRHPGTTSELRDNDVKKDPLVYTTAIIESTMVSVITLFSGKEECLEVTKKALLEGGWPLENVQFIAVDNSGDLKFAERVKSIFSNMGCQFTYVQDSSRAVVDTDAKTFSNDMMMRRKYNRALSAHVAKLYSRAKQHVFTASKLVVTLEDDIQPPYNWMRLLLYGMGKTLASMMIGLVPSRFVEGGIIAFDHKYVRILNSGGAAYIKVGRSGFGCNMMLRSAFDSFVFKYYSSNPLTTAYDWVLCDNLVATGRGIYACTACKCKHIQGDKTFECPDGF